MVVCHDRSLCLLKQAFFCASASCVLRTEQFCLELARHRCGDAHATSPNANTKRLEMVCTGLRTSRSSEPDPFGYPNGSRPIAEEATKPRVSRNKTDKSRRRSWKVEGLCFFCTRTFFYASALRSLEHPLNGGLIYQVILFPSPF